MKGLIFSCIVCEAKKEQTALSKDEQSAQHIFIIFMRKADIRNPLSLLAHERSRFATCQWELLTPTDISIPLTHRLVLHALEAVECLFCVQFCIIIFSPKEKECEKHSRFFTLLHILISLLSD
jgi:hypothetical protein